MTPTQRASMEQALEVLKSVLCDPDGNVCWQGSYADRDIIGDALDVFSAVMAEQPAEQEPVAYMLPRDGDDCAVFREPSSFATRYSPKGWTPLYTAPQPAKPAEQEPVAQRWQPIETAPKGRIVLVYYKNSLGNGRTMRARYYLPETLDSDTTESGWADEGWYEESEAYEYLMPLEHDPTHWMPLPAGPDTAPQPTKQPLTDEEIAALWLDSISGPLTATKFASAVIAAYERKNGIGEKT